MKMKNLKITLMLIFSVLIFESCSLFKKAQASPYSSTADSLANAGMKLEYGMFERMKTDPNPTYANYAASYDSAISILQSKINFDQTRKNNSAILFADQNWLDQLNATKADHQKKVTFNGSQILIAEDWLNQYEKILKTTEANYKNNKI